MMTKVFLYSSNLNYFIYNGFFCSGVPLLKCIDYVILALVVFVDYLDSVLYIIALRVHALILITSWYT